MRSKLKQMLSARPVSPGLEFLLHDMSKVLWVWKRPRTAGKEET